jgi:hypothetical protein
MISAARYHGTDGGEVAGLDGALDDAAQGRPAGRRADAPGASARSAGSAPPARPGAPCPLRATSSPADRSPAAPSRKRRACRSSSSRLRNARWIGVPALRELRLPGAQQGGSPPCRACTRPPTGSPRSSGRRWGSCRPEAPSRAPPGAAARPPAAIAPPPPAPSRTAEAAAPRGAPWAGAAVAEAVGAFAWTTSLRLPWGGVGSVFLSSSQPTRPPASRSAATHRTAPGAGATGVGALRRSPREQGRGHPACLLRRAHHRRQSTQEIKALRLIASSLQGFPVWEWAQSAQ